MYIHLPFLIAKGERKKMLWEIPTSHKEIIELFFKSVTTFPLWFWKRLYAKQLWELRWNWSAQYTVFWEEMREKERRKWVLYLPTSRVSLLYGIKVRDLLIFWSGAAYRNSSLYDSKKASRTFLWSLNCYNCRCYFQSTSVGKLDMKCFLQSAHWEYLQSKGKRGKFGKAKYELKEGLLMKDSHKIKQTLGEILVRY